MLSLCRLRLTRAVIKSILRGRKFIKNTKHNRIVVKNDKGETVLDTLVKPPNEINASSKNQEVYAYSLARAPQYHGVV